MDVQSVLQAEVAILILIIYAILRLIILLAPYLVRFIKWIFKKNHKQKSQEDKIEEFDNTLKELIMSMNDLAEVFREHRSQSDITLTKHEGRINALERDVKEIKRTK